MFHRKNAGVSRDPLRETRIRDGDQCHTTVDYNWKPIDSMKNVLDCIVNYGIAMQYVWTQDFTGYVFIKLFNNFNWLAYNGLKDEKKLFIVTSVFLRVSEENNAKAARKQAPTSYREMEAILKTVLNEEGLPESPPTSAAAFLSLEAPVHRNQQQNRGNNPQGNRGGGNSQRGGSSSGFKRPPAKTPSGRFVCHNFSRGGSAGCSRPKVQNGCKDPNSGEEYAHCCSWFNTNSGTYCFLGHSKSQHK